MKKRKREKLDQKKEAKRKEWEKQLRHNNLDPLRFKLQCMEKGIKELEKEMGEPVKFVRAINHEGFERIREEKGLVKIGENLYVVK